MKNRVLLLGYGFIGFSIAKVLLEDVKNELYVVDHRLNIFLMKNDRITFIRENILDYENWIEKIPKSIDHLINCVNNNEPFIDFICETPDAEYWEHAISNEKVLIDTLVIISNKIKAKRTVYFSSRLVELNNNCIFGYYKSLIEQYIEEKRYPISIFRLPILFGVFQEVSQWPASLIWSVIKGEDVIINDNKSSVYSWLYVADAAMIIVQYIHTLDINKKIITVPGREVSIGLFVEMVQELSKKTIKVKYSDTRQVSRLSCIDNNLESTEECFEEFDERVMLAIEFIEDNAVYYENFKD